jgi:hypothetical protein
MQPLRPYEKLDTFQQFLDYDRHVLRFFCRWDDSPSMFGDVRWLVLHYFLADDTVEVLEKIPANSGRDAVPVFLRRARLPKVWRHSHLSVDVFQLVLDPWITLISLVERSSKFRNQQFFPRLVAD